MGRLGWFTRNPGVKDLNSVVERTVNGFVSGERGRFKYFVEGFPELSEWERALLVELVGGFQASEARASRENIERYFRRHCVENLVELEREQKAYLLRALESCLVGFGPLDCLLAEPAIEEIALIGVGSGKPVFVFHKRFGWLPSNVFFESQQAVCDTVNRMSRTVGRRLSFQTPSVNAVLPNGCRLHAAVPPVSFGGPCFTIRKFSREYFTPLSLIRCNTISLELASFLWMALESGCSVLVAGNTGSGKTSTLNALFSFVPANERIVVVEETPEISLPHKHVVRLNVVREQGIEMHELILHTLRMRPDRVIVGEIRSGVEVKAFIDTLLAGQGKGGYATFHSQSCAEAVKRAMHCGVSPMDLAAVDLVLVQRRWDRIALGSGVRGEVRRVTEVSELLLSGNRVRVNRLFGFDFRRGALLSCGESVRAVEKIERCFSVRGRELQSELQRRQRFLGGLLGKGFSLQRFFEEVNGHGF